MTVNIRFTLHIRNLTPKCPSIPLQIPNSCPPHLYSHVTPYNVRIRVTSTSPQPSYTSVTYAVTFLLSTFLPHPQQHPLLTLTYPDVLTALRFLCDPAAENHPCLTSLRNFSLFYFPTFLGWPDSTSGVSGRIESPRSY